MIKKSVGVVFIDCDKCNPKCLLQQQVRKHENTTVWPPFGSIKEYTIHSVEIIDIEKIAQNAQKNYDLASKLCYNCTEKQR